MDGNNRWSKKNNLDKYTSYKQGANKLIEITNYIFDNYNINFISAFALSKHNFKRGKILINMIEKLLIDFLNQSKDKKNINFRIKFVGNLNFLPKTVFDRLKILENRNIKSKKNLVIFLNYSGKDDIFKTVKIVSKLKRFNSNNFENSLSTAMIPEPDILVRSGGFKRLSDFMLYEVSFTELFFSDKLWPDIKKTDIKKFINQFYKIDRKFGN
tara:strand:- start:465 stop:1103 length:639 start_codon:yes stop_codon:yes gene_type:complete